MSDWARNIALGELVFLAAAVSLLITGTKFVLRGRREGGPYWKGAGLCLGLCVSLVFLRHWALEQEVFRGPTEVVTAPAEKVPEMVEKLRGLNDVVFHYGILLGIPAAFLLGFIFRSFTGLAGRLFFRIPIFAVGCLVLYVAHQLVTDRADSIGEALETLVEWLKGQ